MTDRQKHETHTYMPCNYLSAMAPDKKSFFPSKFPHSKMCQSSPPSFCWNSWQKYSTFFVKSINYIRYVGQLVTKLIAFAKYVELEYGPGHVQMTEVNCSLKVNCLNKYYTKIFWNLKGWNVGKMIHSCVHHFVEIIVS